jgi:ADP-ribosylglycohydrolase
VWALRTTSRFDDALRAAIDLGGDTDTVAAVTGALASAVYGFDAIPARWTEHVHVPLPRGNQTMRLADLVDLAERLAGALASITIAYG